MDTEQEIIFSVHSDDKERLFQLMEYDTVGKFIGFRKFLNL